MAKWGGIMLVTALAAGACTIKVETGEPQVTVKCVQLVLPGGGSSTVCPEAGADAGGD